MYRMRPFIMLLFKIKYNFESFIRIVHFVQCTNGISTVPMLYIKTVRLPEAENHDTNENGDSRPTHSRANTAESVQSTNLFVAPI
jgi:hypothetical protein